MKSRKPTPDPIPRALDIGIAPRPLARADAALGSLALAAVAILASATIAGCTRPDTTGPTNGGGDVIQVDVTAQPADGVHPVSDSTFTPRGACPPPVATVDGIEPRDDAPRLAGEPVAITPATATPHASASGSAKPPATSPNANPPPLPGKPVAPRVQPGGNGRI